MDADDTQDGPKAGTPATPDEIRSARRDAMRKAAIGAAVAGAVWSAPKIEGLSIVPDYAAAATGPGSFTFTTRTADDGGLVDGTGDEIPACGGSGGSFWNVRGPDNPGFTSINAGNTNGSARSVTGPIGPAGNATMTVASGPDNQGELNETRSDISVTLNVDPPFNKCRVSSVTARKCDNNNTTINVNDNPAPTATNTSSPLTIGFTIPGPQPSYLSFVQFTVTCS